MIYIFNYCDYGDYKTLAVMEGPDGLDLGRFETEQLAAKAYNQAAYYYFGEFCLC